MLLRNVLWTFAARCKVCKSKVIIGTTKAMKTCKAAVSWLVCQSVQQASDKIRLMTSSRAGLLNVSDFRTFFTFKFNRTSGRKHEGHNWPVSSRRDNKRTIYVAEWRKDISSFNATLISSEGKKTPRLNKSFACKLTNDIYRPAK